VTQNVSEMNPWPEGANYVEQIQWRDADTGKLLAASDFIPSAAAYATVPVATEVSYTTLLTSVTSLHYKYYHRLPLHQSLQ
jgi:hypothetical protein